MILLLHTVQHALMITSFVFMMMLIIEYINVQTRGNWQRLLKRSRWGSYLIAGLLGALPGCLGAFTVVSLFTHGSLSLGAVVTAMIATSGDEAFVMFAQMPGKALVLTLIILTVGILVGPLTDLLARRRQMHYMTDAHELVLHDDYCPCFVPDQILPQLRRISFARTLLLGLLVLFVAYLLGQPPGGHLLHWKALTFLGGTLIALFIVATVPDHFLEEHLWEHLFKKHLARLFLWTFAALLVINLLGETFDLTGWIEAHLAWVLLLAVLVGIIPESGPHLLFVTLYIQGTIPFGVLLASSIVQDGHGMLPLLADSRRAFLVVKLVNVVVGLLVGGLWLVLFP